MTTTIEDDGPRAYTTDPETLLIYLRGCLSRTDKDGMVNVPASYVTDAIAALRSSSAMDGVGVKPLDWESIDSTSMWASVKAFWWCYRITLRADRMKQLRLEWLGNRNDDLGLFGSWEEAKAAAQADYEARIRSALSPTSDRASVVEECAKVVFVRAEEQSKLQKEAYDNGKDAVGAMHWRAQCELLEAVAAIRALSPRSS